MCLSLQKTPIDLQSLKLIDFHLLQWSAQQRLFTVPRRPHLDAQDLGPATTGKPRLATTTRRLAAVGSKTPEADASRPDLLGLVATRVERLEIRPDDRQG